MLQADEEMDAGDVWKSNNFRVPHSSTLTKSAFYNKVCMLPKGYPLSSTCSIKIPVAMRGRHDNIAAKNEPTLGPTR